MAWEWYLAHEGDKLALAIYEVGPGFIYVVFSRGMLAQTELNFGFSVLPMAVIYSLLPKAKIWSRHFFSHMEIPGRQGVGFATGRPPIPLRRQHRPPSPLSR